MTTETSYNFGNNERQTRGMIKVASGYLALTFAQSKTFKTERGAIRWLAARSIAADGTRLPG